LTHLEQWKWDIWEAESRAKQDELKEARAISSPVEVVDTLEPAQTPAADAAGNSETAAAQSSGVDTEHGLSANVMKEEVDDFKKRVENAGIPSTPNMTTDERLDPPGPSSSSDDTPLTATASAPPEAWDSSTATISVLTIDGSTTARSNDSRTHEISRHTTATDYSSDTVPHASPTFDTSSVSQLFNTSLNQHLPPSYDNTTTVTVNHSRTSSGSPSSATTVISLPQSPAPSATGGESIYRTIMNRLTALEANHTLYARYVEEQTVGVRDMLKRLGEEVGRLEGIVSSRMMCYFATAAHFSLWSVGEGAGADVSAYHCRMGTTEKPTRNGAWRAYVAC